MTAWSKAAEEENASKGHSPQGTTPGWTFGSNDLRVGGSAARPSQGVRNVANPMVGCGVQQTRRPSNE